MLQFVDRKKTPPSYLEKVTLYLHPLGEVVVMMGNQTFRTTPEEAEQFIKSRLEHQAILPLLSEGLIRPAEGKRPARKDHAQIKERVRALRVQMRETGEDADAFMAMTNVIEQACNSYLENGAFPTTYEELQPVPVLSVGQLTFAGDDGMRAGQTYRARIVLAYFCDLRTRQEHRQASLALPLRSPDERGKWAWGAWSEAIHLPAAVSDYLCQGATTQAPTLREIKGDDGSRVAVLDLVLEVPASYVSPLDEERRVLGFDWGVRSLITASVLERGEADEPYRQ